jgi:hypothetical protein
MLSLCRLTSDSSSATKFLWLSLPAALVLVLRYTPLYSHSLDSVCPKSKSKLCYDRRSVGQSVFVSTPIWGARLDFYYYQTVAGLLMWGVLSDERMCLPFTIADGPR